MINFFKKPNEKIFNLAKLDAGALIYKVFPRFFMELMKKYFRLEVIGIENLPRKGPVIICPNHSGFSGFDALILAYVLQQQTKRIPRVMSQVGLSTIPRRSGARFKRRQLKRLKK